MKTLVICGDYWHPAEIVKRGMHALPDAADFGFDFVEDAKDLLYPDMLAQYDVIVNAKMDVLTEGNQHEWFQKNVTEVMPADLRAWTEGGKGFLALHGGTAFYQQDTTGYVDFVGNYFVKHPDRCAIHMTMEADHPITRGVPDFDYRDEHYELTPVCDDLIVLCTSHSPAGGDQLGGYVRQVGDGRLCMLAPGHIYQTWLNPAFQQLLSNAIRWCAGELK